ncbi:MAG: hypothetical protein KGJ01_01105 [Patescibacteria group bacterium]|nr:hypothetical protein [Patescibacteria group bacterium]
MPINGKLESVSNQLLRRGEKTVQTKHDNESLKALLAFLVVVIVGVGAITGAKYLGTLHPQSRFAFWMQVGQGAPPPPPLPKNGNVKIEGPSDFQAQMAQAMATLKTEAPNSYARFVAPTLRLIQYASNNGGPYDNVGVINMGWWELNESGSVGIFAWSSTSFPNVPHTSNAVPKKVYQDPRWIAAVIVGFTVYSTVPDEGITYTKYANPNWRQADPACALYLTLKEMGAYLQYTDPNACSVSSFR